MNFKDCIHLKTKTISTGEYLPLETNVIVNIPEHYINNQAYLYRFLIDRCLNTAIRLLEYNGNDYDGYERMGITEISNSSRIKSRLKASTPVQSFPNGVIITAQVTFTKIADDTSFTVVPRDNTTFEMQGFFDELSSAIEVSFSDNIKGYLSHIYEYPENSTEYWNLYGKLQLTNFIATLVRDKDWVAPTND